MVLYTTQTLSNKKHAFAFVQSGDHVFKKVFSSLISGFCLTQDSRESSFEARHIDTCWHCDIAESPKCFQVVALNCYTFVVHHTCLEPVWTCCIPGPMGLVGVLPPFKGSRFGFQFSLLPAARITWKTWKERVHKMNQVKGHSYVVNVGFRVADACISSSSVFSLVVKFSRTFCTVRFVCTELPYWTEPLPVLDWCFLHIAWKQCSWLVRSNPRFCFEVEGQFSSDAKISPQNSKRHPYYAILQLGFYDHFSVAGGQSKVGCNLHLVLIELSRFYGYYITFLRVAPRWLFQFSTVWLKYGRSLCRRWFMYVFIYTIGLNSHYWIYWTVRTVLTHKILWQFVGLRGAEVLQQTEQRQWWAAFNPSDVSLRAVALVTWSAHFAPWLTILMWPAGFPSWHLEKIRSRR